MPVRVLSFDCARASCASFGFSCSRQQNFGILSFSRCSGHQKMRFSLFLILLVRQRNKCIHIWLKILFAAWCHEPFLGPFCFRLPWQCCTACYYCCPRQPWRRHLITTRGQRHGYSHFHAWPWLLARPLVSDHWTRTLSSWNLVLQSMWKAEIYKLHGKRIAIAIYIYSYSFLYL